MVTRWRIFNAGWIATAFAASVCVFFARDTFHIPDHATAHISGFPPASDIVQTLGVSQAVVVVIVIFAASLAVLWLLNRMGSRNSAKPSQSANYDAKFEIEKAGIRGSITFAAVGLLGAFLALVTVGIGAVIALLSYS